jgi:hypothetical protein
MIVSWEYVRQGRQRQETIIRITLNSEFLMLAISLSCLKSHYTQIGVTRHEVEASISDSHSYRAT